VRKDICELQFLKRDDFREWLKNNSENSEGVWLVFGKTKEVITLSANDALEEALCFGWIDGQMKSIDNNKYLKYFAKRRLKSVWSEKNKKTVDILREKGLMTKLGEKAVEIAKENGMWDSSVGKAITDEQIEEFTKKLIGIFPAYTNFNNMPLSIRRTYTRRYFSFKTEEARIRDFEKIIDRLNNNLKPM
jgi:uncharacterized protein YdeI (YjbR/CyaY-like superfamily)